MKLLLDQGLPRSAAGLLNEIGHECVHIADIAPPDTEDDSILAIAASDGRVVVTLDADFHATLALRGARLPSVIRIRVEGLKAIEVSRFVAAVAARCEKELLAGALVSVEAHTVRVRSLPIA